METIASNEMKKNSDDNLSILLIDITGLKTDSNSIESLDLESKILLFKSILIGRPVAVTLNDKKIKFSNNRIYYYLFNNKGVNVETTNTFFENQIVYSYKQNKMFNFYKNLVNKFPFKIVKNVESEIDYTSNNLELDVNSLKEFLLELIKVDKAQVLLKKINLGECLEFIKSNLKSAVWNDFQEKLYFRSGVSSTLPVFLEVDKHIINKKYINPTYKSILSAACRNSDIRVLKYIVSNLNLYHNNSNSNRNYISNIIQQIFSYHIPTKYSLRRLKIINSKINLSPYFDIMVNNLDGFNVLMILGKYYGKNFDYDSKENNNSSGFLFSLLRLTFNIDENVQSFSERIKELFSIFDSKILKFDFLMASYLKHNSLFDMDILEFFEPTKKFIKSAKTSISDLARNILHRKKDHHKLFKSSDLKKIFSIYTPPIVNYLTYRNLTSLLFIMPFINFYTEQEQGLTFKLSSENLYIGTKLNFIKFKLKIWLRGKYKILKLESKFKEKQLMMCVDKEDNYNNCSPKVPFSRIPPRHILPFENFSFSETVEGLYLLREKADGCLVEFIANDVEPKIEEYCNHIVKAEFIEDLDLYLIFDIKTNEDMTVSEKYNYIRSLHPATRDKDLKSITSFDELCKEIKDERDNFDKFLNKDYDNYRIYPKPAWLVKNIDDEINSQLISKMLSESAQLFITDCGSYRNDGLVISPLNGSREIKVKPLSLHTIDVLNNGKFWQDREGNNLDFMINDSDKEFSKDSIWRCYPTFNKNDFGYYTFEPREFRFDKSKPNKSQLIDTIYNLHILNWNKLISPPKGYFYHKSTKVYSDEWKSLCRIQNNHLEYVLDNMNPNLKSNWLDLGCDSSKLLNYIKQYNPKKYIGVDFDILRMLKGINRIDKSNIFQNYSNISVVDLTKEWMNTELSWSTFNKDKFIEKFDYVVANFSLGHFISENFWTNLNDFVKTDTHFIFNLVNSNCSSAWSYESSYMKLEDDFVKYKFEANDNEMVEKFISKTEIEDSLQKFGWEIVDTLMPIGNDLDSKYTWYIVKKR